MRGPLGIDDEELLGPSHVAYRIAEIKVRVPGDSLEVHLLQDFPRDGSFEQVPGVTIPSQRLFSLTIVFFYEYAHGRYALNGCVTCSPDSPISYSRFLYHVPPARVLVCFLSVLRVSLTCTSMDCRLVSGYLFVSRFSFRLIDSSTYVSCLCLSPSVLSIRLSARYFWTMTRY